MTPDETSPAPVDAQFLAHMMACDALLHGSASADRAISDFSPSTTGEDDRARGRLLLLLKMLEAPEIATDQSVDGVAGADRQIAADSRPLLGRFQVKRELGSGGFGFVVHARDQLLGRDVALKMPLPERVLSTGDVHRFLREARAVARLDHPNIVRVFEAGELGPLGYYIASEFCDGPSLKHWLKAQDAPVPALVAARWLASLADAVQHAHDRGILHRDIKPDNVILTGPSGQDFRPFKATTAASESDLTPRLTDFGLAKLVEETGDDTRSDGRIGTPHYMAPEQAAGHRREIGPATDIYALGATLYQILTGRPPFSGATEVETLRLLLDTEPVVLRAFRPELPRDLETICLKCLRKKPASRYASASALRDDLERFLSDRPIVGRPVSAWERARSWSRRRPAVAALLALVIVLTGGLIAGITGWSAQLRRQNVKLEQEVARADGQTIEAEKHARLAEERRHQADRHHYAESLRLARRALDSRQIELAQDILHDVRPGPDGVDPRGFAWRYLWRHAHREFSQLWGHEAIVTDHDVTPAGRGLATRDARGKVLLWDLAPGMKLDEPRVIQSLPDPNNNWIAFSNDGRSIATIDLESSRQSISVFDFASGRQLTRLDCGRIEYFGGGLIDAGTQRLAIVASPPGGARSVHWWDIFSGHAAAHSRAVTSGTSLCRIPAHGRFVVATEGGRTRLLDPWSGERRGEFVESNLSPAGNGELWSFSADGLVFAAHTTSNHIVLWDMASGRELSRCEAGENVCGIALSSTGSRLAMLNREGKLTVFDRSTKRSRVLASGTGGLVESHTLSFSSDETLLAIGLDAHPGGPQPPEVWEIATATRLAQFPGRNLGRDVKFLARSRSLILVDGTRPRIWRLDPPSEPDRLAGHAVEAWAIAFSPDGKVLATGSDDTKERQTIKLWDLKSGRLVAGWMGHTATVAALAFSPDGRMLASSSFDSGEPGHTNVTLWDSLSQKRLANLEGHSGWVRSIAFSPDGQYLATASNDLTARVWDVTERKTRSVLAGHTNKLTSVAFRPDGRMLATASNDATVRLWDVATGETRATFTDEGNVLGVAFHPDGSLLASVNEEGAIKLWDLARGELIRTIRAESNQLRCLSFSPDGRNVAAAGKGKIVRIWDVPTGQELLSLEGHEAQINALAFSVDGSTLVSCDHQGNVKLWHARWPGLAIGP